jgi:hypothetical protein
MAVDAGQTKRHMRIVWKRDRLLLRVTCNRTERRKAQASPKSYRLPTPTTRQLCISCICSSLNHQGFPRSNVRIAYLTRIYRI